jgi:excisionase family DNA binding protein
MKPVDLPLFLTVPEVARLVRISKPTLYAAIKRGEIPSVKIAGCLRITRQTVLAWLEQGGVAQTIGGNRCP